MKIFVSEACSSCGVKFTPEHPWDLGACSGDWLVFFHKECSPRSILGPFLEDKLRLLMWCLWPTHLYLWPKVIVGGPAYLTSIWKLAVCIYLAVSIALVMMVESLRH